MIINHNFKFSSINTFVNPYSWLLLRDNKDIANHFEIYADGILVVWLHNLFFKDKIKRFSFDDTSLAPIVFNHIVNNKMSLYLVGGKKGVMEEASSLLQKRYRNLNIIGYSSGFFSNNKDRESVLEKASYADVVICGMGTPNQELFLLDIKRKYKKSIIGFTCGGYLDQLIESNGENYYPYFFDKFNIRWVYRLYKEPKRLWRRYTFYYPLFVYQYTLDTIKKRIRK